MTSRLYQFTLIASTFGYSWLGMQIVHELGHVSAALSSGATINHVVLHPLAFSRTDVAGDRNPLLTIWAGPIVGSMLPVVLLAIAKLAKSRFFYLFQFFAGFCLVANGTYVGIGSFWGVGDAGDLLRHGSARSVLIAFGLVSTAAGLWLWNGLGRYFGLGASKGTVDRGAVRWAVGVVSAIVLIELIAGSR